MKHLEGCLCTKCRVQKWNNEYRGLFCEDDFDPLTGGPDEWTEADEKEFQRRKKKLDIRSKT